jgi:hypothetical protein
MTGTARITKGKLRRSEDSAISARGEVCEPATRQSTDTSAIEAL